MRQTILKVVLSGLTGVLCLASCSDSFLEDKENYQFVGPSIYQDYDGCKGRVDNIYYFCLPDVKNADYRFNAVGLNDSQSGSTEEYTGFTDFVDPDIELKAIGGTEVPDFFQNVPNNIQAMPYGYIRLINDAIEGITGSTGITDEQKAELLGQCYFFRGWQYYKMFKWYGGLVLVDKVMDPVPESNMPRSSAKATYDFIIADLNRAADYLKGLKLDYGRVTASAALALKGRVMALWCSPMFNRKGDTNRYREAYDVMKADLDVISGEGYHLYEDNTGTGIAYSFAKLFTVPYNNPEAIFFTQYNQSMADATNKNNPWERTIRPSNATGSGLAAGALLVDLFPNRDGLVPKAMQNAGYYTKLKPSESEIQDRNYPFIDRDPRFYRTFAFPGVIWQYEGNATLDDKNNPYTDGSKYALWNYVWYTNAEQREQIDGKAYGAGNLLANVKGIYVRKRSDDLGVNAAPLYAAGQQKLFTLSKAALIEIRYAEVLLNLAEVAAGTGDADAATYAIDNCLKPIRRRAGYTGNCGFDNDLKSDQGALMSAVLYERQVELAYEGKRFDDLRRWLLFDGGTVKMPGAPDTWTLDGIWANGTDAFLGYKKLNDTYRWNMVFRIQDKSTYNNGIGGTTVDSDPLPLKFKPSATNAVDLNQTTTDLDKKLNTLKSWYSSRIERWNVKGDRLDETSEPTKKIYFRPQYYFLGFKSGVLDHCKLVQQTIGWYDTNTQSDGGFDPLAE